MWNKILHLDMLNDLLTVTLLLRSGPQSLIFFFSFGYTTWFSSPTKDSACTLISESAESWPRDHREFLISDSFLIVAVQSLSRVWLFATPWTAACQDPPFFTVSWSLLKLMSPESVMPSNHLILCCPFLLPPSIFPSIRVSSSESALHIRWPRY